MTGLLDTVGRRTGVHRICKHPLPLRKLCQGSRIIAPSVCSFKQKRFLTIFSNPVSACITIKSDLGSDATLKFLTPLLLCGLLGLKALPFNVYHGKVAAKCIHPLLVYVKEVNHLQVQYEVLHDPTVNNSRFTPKVN
jgi:hypothetical protein